MAIHGVWTHGDPRSLANEFFAATEERARMHGQKAYMLFVTAIASASVHNLLAQANGIDNTILRQMHHIFFTAECVEQLVGSRIPAEQESDDGDSGDDGVYDSARSGLRGNLNHYVSPLVLLRSAIDEATAAHEAERESAAQGPFAPGLENGLRLPNGVILSILRRLDPRSAAAVAATCRQLRLQHRLIRFLELSAPFRVYLTILQRIQKDDFDGGDLESQFAVDIPLDGSRSCGADLTEETQNRRMHANMHNMVHMFSHLGGHPGERTYDDFRRTMETRVHEQCAPPHYLSSPLAFFKAAAAVPMAALPPSTSGPYNPAAAAINRSCPLATALCDVQTCNLPMGLMHCEGDLLAIAYPCGHNGCDPGLSAAVLSSAATTGGHYPRCGLLAGECTPYYHGLFNSVSRLRADSVNGLVWAAADNGRRIKAFRAPEPARPRSWAAGCNRGHPNGMPLQYTFCSDVRGASGRHAGVHVMDTQLLSVKGNGALLVWDLASLPAQTAHRHPNLMPGGDQEPYFEPPFRSTIGSRRIEDPRELEVTPGTPPHYMRILPVPSTYNVGSSTSSPSARSRTAGDADSWDEHGSLTGSGSGSDDVIRDTCLLGAEPGATISPTLVASYRQYNIILSYDLATQRVKQCLFGHLFEITELAPAPASWGQEHLFASASITGDVKIWDLRARGGSAAVTLATGTTDSLFTVALVHAAAGGRLGAGMVCFAGGAGESVWSWDLRYGHARPMYELSTGNTVVESLVWHGGSNSLLASCKSQWADPTERRRDYWKEVHVCHGGDGGAQPIERRLWPSRALHQPEDFRRYFNMARSCVLRFSFSEHAARGVPESVDPDFGNNYY